MPTLGNLHVDVKAHDPGSSILGLTQGELDCTSAVVQLTMDMLGVAPGDKKGEMVVKQTNLWDKYKILPYPNKRDS